MRSPSQIFLPEDLKWMKEEASLLKSKYERLLLMTTGVASLLKEPKAKEYMTHGVGRRLGVIKRSVENIYLIFPLERDCFLSRDELYDIAINLHAFFINIFGLLDNLAWVIAHESGKEGKIRRQEVNLFKDKIKVLAPESFRDYLNLGHLKKWYDEYLVDYRDTLAHRIAPYLPRETLTEDQQKQVASIQNSFNEQYKLGNFFETLRLQDEMDLIGDPCPAFRHAVEESKAVVLHPQLITDFKTVEEVIEKFCIGFGVSERTENGPGHSKGTGPKGAGGKQTFWFGPFSG